VSKTERNLAEAFAGESQANRKYLAFAAKADKEGLKQVAKLLRAAAEAETVHAHNHLRAMKGVGSTAENLQAAIGGETHEFESMYPPMVEDAKTEGDKIAQKSFEYANAVEKVHAELFKRAAEKMEKLEETDIYVCKVCGNTVEGEPPDKCPICNSPKSAFNKIE
jgi:rubrerythrin